MNTLDSNHSNIIETLNFLNERSIFSKSEILTLNNKFITNSLTEIDFNNNNNENPLLFQNSMIIYEQSKNQTLFIHSVKSKIVIKIV